MKSRQSQDASKKIGKPFVPRRQTEFKPKSPDGIWLDRRGEDNNWELFRTQFIDMATREFGEIAQELGAADDLDEEIAEPHGDPNSFDYKIEMERLKLVLKKRDAFETLRPKLFGSILCHLCLESERIVKDHADFAAANAQKSPRLLWEIVRATHVVPQHAGNMGMWFQRNKLYSMRQASGQRIEAYSRQFRQEYEKLLALDGELPQDVAAQVYLISLDGDIFSDKVAEWTRAGEVPETLEASIALAVEWYKTRSNARMAMGGTTRRERLEAAFGATHVTSGGADEMCPICKRPATHAVDKCWELQSFAERAKAAGNDGSQIRRVKDKAKSKQVKPKSALAGSKGSKTHKGEDKKGQRAWAARDDGEDLAHEATMSEAAWSARSPFGHKIAELGKAASQAACVASRAHRTRIILDSGASVSVWSDTLPVDNIRQTRPITVHGLDGMISSDTWGEHRILGCGIIVAGMNINLVSLSEIEKRARVEYSQRNKGFKVTFSGTDPLYFDLNAEGLYQLRENAAAMLSSRLELHDTGEYTKREVDQARKARDLCKCLGHVGTEGLTRIIQSGTIVNMPVSVQDVKRADSIFGPCLSCALGKGTKRTDNYVPHGLQEPRVVNESTIEHLHADFVYIPGPGKAKHVVLVSVGEVNRLIITTKVDNRSTQTLCEAWDAHLLPYRSNGISVKVISTDNEASLGASEPYLASLGIALRQHSSGQHEPHVERRIRTIRDRMRAVLADLVYTLPARLYYALMQWVVQCINVTPDTLDAGDVRCARERVSGQRLDARFMLSNFGESVVYHTENHALNNLARRNDLGIIIGRKPETGIVRIWNPTSLRVCERRTFRRVDTPQSMINAINEVASRERTTDAAHELLDNDLIEMENDNIVPNEIAHTDLDVPPDDPLQDADADAEAIELADEPDTAELQNQREDPETVFDTNDGPDEDTPDDVQAEPMSAEEQEPDEDVPEQHANEPFLEPRYNLRRKERRDYKNLSRLSAMTVLTSSQAIKDFPTAGPAAIRAELENLLKYNTFVPATAEEAKVAKVIPCKLFVKVKTKPDGTFDRLKGRVVAGGHRQHWVEDSSSPTVAWETFLLGMATAAQARLDMKVLDVPSAYLNAEGSSLVIMELPVDVANILLELRPEWRRCLHQGRMLVRVLKALYGLRDSGRQWYDHLSTTLSTAGLEASGADKCLFTKRRDNAPVTIVLVYVDDLCLLGKTEELKKIINTLERKYGSLTVQEKSPFSFVGTTICWTPKGISLSCPGYVKKLAAQHGVTASSDTPTPSNYSPKQETGAPPADIDKYRSLIMSLMYIAKRCRPDVLTNVALLATHVGSPSIHHERAALKALRYLLGTAELGLIFSSDRRGLELCADAAFNVHPDSKSHSGAAVLAGGTPVFYKSTKQRLVSKSSTEAEIIACDMGIDMLMHIALLANIIGYKYDVPLTVIQDNKSSVTIMERGRFTKKRGPINVRFEYILQLLNEKKICFRYQPTHLIVADILTKILHGAAFKTAAQRILGHASA